MIQYTSRIIDTELDELLSSLPAVAIDGPKGVGKTATAERRAGTVFRLDSPGHRNIAEADPAALLTATPPVLIDEWQHVPSVWDAVRRAVDAGVAPGQFLLTGSASPNIAPTHSGAGRIVSLRMRPLSLAERGLGSTTVSLRALLSGERGAVSGTSTIDLMGYAREIVVSGFPGLRSFTGRGLRASLDGYLTRVVDRDFVEQGFAVRRPDALRRWMTAYAAATATTTSLEKIRNAATSGDGATTGRPTVQAYRDVLERLWLIEPVPGWLPSRNQLARLVQAPRHHLADPALAARLLGVDIEALLHGATSPLFDSDSSIDARATTPRDGTLLGQLFESLVTLSVRVYAEALEARVRHLREHDGRHEVDLIVERADGKIVALEVKLSASVDDH
ncbi:MAG TPA: AAA family ATPase, partial [Gemmatimonas sp.]|nr:AAA family ATPase [Gemmatimonas sp.]